MGLLDRDWYNEAIKERDAANARPRVTGATRRRPGAATVATLVLLACMLAGAVYADIRSTGAPLTAKGVAFWWSVRTGGK